MATNYLWTWPKLQQILVTCLGFVLVFETSAFNANMGRGTVVSLEVNLLDLSMLDERFCCTKINASNQ